MKQDENGIERMARDYAAAWSGGDPRAVSSFYASDGEICINRGDALIGRDAITEMAAGFYAEFPDLVVHLDQIRAAGNHAAFLWTPEGTHSETGNRVKVSGWEEWDLTDALQVARSRGWFDQAEYDRQVAEGL